MLLGIKMCEVMKASAFPFSSLVILLIGLSLAPVQAQFTGSFNLGDASPAGSITTNGPGSFTVTGGGGSQNRADRYFFVYQPVTNDFDVRVRLEFLQDREFFGQAGLVAREDLEQIDRLPPRS